MAGNGSPSAGSKAVPNGGRSNHASDGSGFGDSLRGDDDLALAAGFGDLSLHRDIEGGGYDLPEGLAGNIPGARGIPGIPGGGAVALGFGLYATLRSVREFGFNALGKAMKAAWTPLGKMEMTVVEDNFFLFRFEYRQDVIKVLRDGPWRFDNHPLAVMEARPGEEVRKEDLVMVPYWIQIYNIPPFYQTEETTRHVGSLISDEVIAVDATVRKQPGVALSFVRVKVAINTDYRLPRGTSMGKGVNEVKMAFKYERLLNFCYLCGLVDHEMADCVSPIPEGVDVKKPPYGDWLRGIPPRIPAWQRNGVGIDSEANNPFVSVSNRNRRPGVIPAPLPHRLMEGNRPRLGAPPGFTQPFHPGSNPALPPPKKTRNTRQKSEEGGSELGKRSADDMEISEDGVRGTPSLQE